jgi:hypothetical protein
MRWNHYPSSKLINLSLKEEKSVQFAKITLKLARMSLDYPVCMYCITLLRSRLTSSHQDCITPWLKINGSCPVCRHTINPQNNNTNEDVPPGSPPTQPSSPGPSGQHPLGGAGGWLGSLFNFAGNRGSSSGTGGAGNTGASASAGGDNQRYRRDDSLPPEEDLD